jgi:hypothetical protein
MLALCILAALAGADEPPAAMVLKSDGATAAIGKTTRNLRDGDMVPAGAALKSGKGELYLLIRATGTTEKLAAGRTATLRATGCVGAGVTRSRRKISSAQLARLQKLIGGSGGIGFLRGKPREVVGNGIYPIHTGVIDTSKPSFRWAAVEGAESYTAVLFSGSKGSLKEEWRQTTKKPALDWPSGVSALKPGAPRTWAVLVKVKGKEKPTVLVADVEFTVMDEDTARDAVALRGLTESKDSGDWLLAAVAYEAIAAYDLALAQYLRVDKARPGQKQVLEALKYCYKLAKDEAKVKEVEARLKKLKVQPKKEGESLTAEEEAWLKEMVAAEKKDVDKKNLEKAFKESSHAVRRGLYGIFLKIKHEGAAGWRGQPECSGTGRSVSTT